MKTYWNKDTKRLPILINTAKCRHKLLFQNYGKQPDFRISVLNSTAPGVARIKEKN